MENKDINLYDIFTRYSYNNIQIKCAREAVKFQLI
ncbi:hypothetical protein CLLI_09960 [Clostridium liquoris]|jgi:hypothetical protein|uniref:Uncharacterized protein n=1 Tax=Clostridium liquoris TaxID=1289519 RepID=A0A2T0B5H6_9CLOT|nr:hypothetical protein CLLI_09960 [Clostridium liquoris]